MYLTADDFHHQMGGDVAVPDKDWSYKIVGKQEREDILIDLIRRYEERDFSKVTGDKSRWEKGWNENLEMAKKNGLMGLEPAFIRSNQVLRLNSNFIYAVRPTFERDWYEVFRNYLFQTYLKGHEHIFEFGCGSGFNISLLSDIFPDSHITGLDWVQPSVDILTWMNKPNIKGRLFDFFEPDYSLDIPSNSAVLTIGAMEQTGKNHVQFLAFLLDKKPSIVVHSEPIVEWYSADNLVDVMAAKIHRARNFWQGYLGELYRLRDAGRIEIIKEHRTGFGSLLLEGYSQLIWRPL